jgi:heme-degrading monooxygenase HmoA
MYAVIFEVWPTSEGKGEYLQIAAKLKEFLENCEGFISIERFQSLTDENKLLSLSFWEDEKSIEIWRNMFEHRIAQDKGNTGIFDDYRIRVANVLRDYTKENREQAPKDSNERRV